MATLGPDDGNRDLDALFRSFLECSIEWSRAVIEQVEGPLPSAMVNQALHVLSFALKDAGVWPATRRLVLALAPRMERDGIREELHALLDSALQRSHEFDDAATEAELYWQLGVLHLLQGRNSQAQAVLEASAALFAGLGAPRDQARALDRLAQAVQRQQRLGDAERLLGQAGRLLPARDPEHVYRLFVYGNVALARRQWHRARVCFTQAFCLLQAGDDLRMLAWASVNLGVAFVQLEQYQSGMAWYLRGIDLFRLVGDPVHRAVAQMNLGVVYAMTGQPDQALEQYAQAEPVFRNAADVRRQAMVYNNIGYAHGLQGRWAEAEPAYRLAVQLHREAGNVVGMVDTMDSLAQCLEALEQGDVAAQVLQNALRLLDMHEPDSGKQYVREMVAAHLARMPAQGQSA